MHSKGEHSKGSLIHDNVQRHPDRRQSLCARPRALAAVQGRRARHDRQQPHLRSRSTRRALQPDRGRVGRPCRTRRARMTHRRQRAARRPVDTVRLPFVISAEPAMSECTKPTTSRWIAGPAAPISGSYTTVARSKVSGGVVQPRHSACQPMRGTRGARTTSVDPQRRRHFHVTAISSTRRIVAERQSRVAAHHRRRVRSRWLPESAPTQHAFVAGEVGSGDDGTAKHCLLPMQARTAS